MANDGDDDGMLHDGDDDRVLRVARIEARATLDHQLAALDDMDQKAMRLLRLDVALASVLVTALSLTVGTSIEVTEFINPYVGVAVAALVGSAIAAALTYTATAQVVGIDATALNALTDHSDTAIYRQLVAGYADWIQFNQLTNVHKAPLLTGAILGLVVAVVFLTLGALAALAFVTLTVQVVAAAVLVIAVYGSGLHRQLQRLREPVDRSGTVTTESLVDGFDGQQTFKGDSVRGEPSQLEE